MSTYNEYLDFLQHTDNNSRQEVEKKINGLQDDIKALKSSLNTLQKDRDRISDDLAKTKKVVNDKEDELNMKSVEIESMLKKQKEKDNENKKLLEEQARKSEKKISELKSQNEQRFSELQKQSNKDKGLLEQLREEKAALQKERDKLSSKLAQQNSTNEADKQALNKQLESEKQTIKRLEEKIRSLNEEQEQLLEQLKVGAEEKGGENTQEVLFWKQKYEAANQALTDLKAEQNVSAQQIAEFKQTPDQKDILEKTAKKNVNVKSGTSSQIIKKWMLLPAYVKCIVYFSLCIIIGGVIGLVSSIIHYHMYGGYNDTLDDEIITIGFIYGFLFGIITVLIYVIKLFINGNKVYSAPKIKEQPAKASSRNWIWGAISAVAIIIIFVMGGLYAQSQKTISDMEEKEKTYLNAFTHFIENPNSFTPDNIVSLTYLKMINKLIYSLKEQGELPTESGAHFFYGFVCEKLAYMEPEEAIKRLYMKEAVEWYESAANNVVSPYTRAKVALGKLYQKGYMMEPDIDKAIQLYREAADEGYADAMIKMGQLYEEGIGVNRSFEEACVWYQKVANMGIAKGMGAFAHVAGNSLSDSIKVSWARKAAILGDPKGTNDLAFYYKYDYGNIEKNDIVNLLYSIAAKRYEQVANNGDDDAQCEYAEQSAYHGKFGLSSATEEKLLEEAAKHGNATAQYILGLWRLDDNFGRRLDRDEGVKWMKEAARRGYKYAQDELDKISQGYSN